MHDDRAAGPTFEIIIESNGWREAGIDLDAFVARWTSAVTAREPAAGGAIALLLGDDARLAELNQRFRGKTGPTNVLSFPSGEAAPSFIGDIAMAFETCAREASENGTPFEHHFAHLLVHGVLHLIGYDHVAEDEANEMERLEIDILASEGIANPYAETCEPASAAGART
ncbi:MAG: rRNA maturation RNase YbeY [Alphaproteobacteria bacterium]|nr:rRNA maturation RNase YbeY [Alphaproteobacteria bacterium]